MKKITAIAILLTLLFIFAIPTSAGELVPYEPAVSSETWTFTDNDSGLSFEMPIEWQVTQPTTLSVYSFYSTDKPYLGLGYYSLDIFNLYAIELGIYTRENFNAENLNRHQIAEIYGDITSSDVTFTYINGKKYFEIRDTAEESGITGNIKLYVTFHNGWMHVFNLTGIGNIDNVAIWDKILETAKYPEVTDSYPVSEPETTTASEPSVFVPDTSTSASPWTFTDDKTGLSFEIPGEWEISSSSDAQATRFSNENDPFMILSYSSVDAFKPGVAGVFSREQFNMENISRYDLEEIYSELSLGTISSNDIISVNINGVKYYLISYSPKVDYQGYDVQSYNKIYVTFDNGWMYSFTATSILNIESNTVWNQILESVEFPDAVNDSQKTPTTDKNSSNNELDSSVSLLLIIYMLIFAIAPIAIIVLVIVSIAMAGKSSIRRDGSVKPGKTAIDKLTDVGIVIMALILTFIAAFAFGMIIYMITGVSFMLGFLPLMGLLFLFKKIFSDLYYNRKIRRITKHLKATGQPTLYDNIKDYVDPAIIDYCKIYNERGQFATVKQYLKQQFKAKNFTRDIYIILLEEFTK